MSQSDRAIKKFATQLARLDREVKSWRGAQADFTSIENGGNFTFKDADGNVTAVVGGQDDGSNTIRHVDGPTPPIPSGLSAHVDGPIVQVSWDGTFEDADTATWDWSHLEVVVVGPSNEQLTATINDVTGATANLAATVSGEWTVVARSVSRAEKRSLDGGAGTVDVELVGLTGAINDAIGSANGKNTVHYSEVPPTPADEGVLGDTWFVNQVNPETGTMLITEQWQYVTEWVQTELNHQVIATVDLGKATVGELDGARIMGQTIHGEQLSGDAIDGMVITGATYRTSGGTGSWSDDGLFIAQPDGTSMVRFPTDGSPLSLTASDTQIDRASIADLDLSFGSVRSGGEFTLASGVTPPASPPELTTGWQKVCTLEKTGAVDPTRQLPYRFNGFGYWAEGAGHWVRAVNVLSSGTWDRVELYDAATGEFERYISIDCDPRNGLTVMGDIVYVFGNAHGSGGEALIDGYNLVTGVRVSRHPYTRAIQAQNALGNDGTNLVIASVYNLELWVHRRNPVTGVQVGSDMRSGSNSWPASGGKDLYAVRISGNDVEVVTASGSRVYLNSNNALVRKTDTANASGYAGWVIPSHVAAGMVMKAGRFGAIVPFVVDGTGAVYEGAQFSSDTNVSSCFTWFDGTNETAPSPIATVKLPAMNVVSASLPKRTNLQKRLYTREQGGQWRVTEVDANTTIVTLGRDSGALIPGTGGRSNLAQNPGMGSLRAQLGEGDMLSGGGSVLSLSTQWATSGSTSLAISSASNQWSSAYITPGHARGTSLPVAQGGTATIAADFHLPQKQTGNINTEARRLVIGYRKENGEMVNEWVRSPQLPNTSGATGRLVVVVTVPSDAVAMSVRAMNGCDGGQAVLVDSVTIESASTDGSWFEQSLPTTNTFPNADPATLKSTNDKFEVKGDGSGRWGPLTFNPDGTMSSSAVPAWVPITSFASGFSVNSWGFAPAYRVWPDGKVEWRGVVSGSFTGTIAATPFVIPVAARPAQPVNSVAACNIVSGGSEGHVRVEFSADDRPTQISVYAAGKARSWLALDNLTYYKS